jgi:hypothetical protein
LENDCEVFDERKGMNEFEMVTSFLLSVTRAKKKRKEKMIKMATR